MTKLAQTTRYIFMHRGSTPQRTDLAQHIAQSEEEDDREDGENAGNGHTKHHCQLLLLG